MNEPEATPDQLTPDVVIRNASDQAQDDYHSPRSPDEEDGHRRSVNAIVSVIILFIINLLNYMDRFTIAGVLSDVQLYFNIEDADAGLLQTVFVISFMLFAPLFGYLGDRYSRKKIMIVGISIWSAAVLLSTFVPGNSFWAFALLRAVVGIGEASYTTVAPTIIADLFTKDMRSRMLMLFYFAIPVGSGLGFVVGSEVTKAANHQWQWGVRVTPLFGVICCFLIALVIQEPARGAAEVDSASLHDVSARTPWRTDLRLLLKNQSYIWSTLGFTCVAFVAGSLTWWAPTYILAGERIKLKTPDKARISLIFGIITCAAGVVGVGGGSAWAQTWRRWNPRADPLVCGIGMLVCTPFLFGALVATKTHLAAAWCLIFVAITTVSFNWALVLDILTANIFLAATADSLCFAVNADILLYVVVPSRRSTASAFQILVSHLFGDATSPYIVGKMSDMLRDGPLLRKYGDPTVAHYYALQYSMFLPTFVCVLGGFFFLGTAWYIQGDRRKEELVAKGLIPVDADVPAPPLSATVTSGTLPAPGTGVHPLGGSGPSPDRTGLLINATAANNRRPNLVNIEDD